MYIIYLSEHFHSASKIQEAVCSITWAHSLAGYDDPCQSSLVKQCREGALRETSKPVHKKEPISPQHLNLLVEKYGKDFCTLADLRLISMCLIGYTGFLRFSEIANIKRSHIEFFDEYLSIFIPKSKTDKFNEGSHVYISKTQSKSCPVKMLSRYLKLAGIDSSSTEFIFRQVTFLKKTNSYMLRKCDKPLSYTRAREIILSALESIGLDQSKFGIHSLRSGGATAAAAAGINDRIFKKHGRWRSEKAKDGYVKESLQEKLSVSKKSWYLISIL
ncbi:hypothetical protein FSP39_021460 [Pinctada imbricata]|uniref:Tyr recombinase domain-containing protein n=1 Tax=Pinctada imbricata TaxID=66713 RepID=A0AA89BXU0_PINIB|nr:hypothetical protein FSP39_021460 [Pinctada imbricata]